MFSLITYPTMKARTRKTEGDWEARWFRDLSGERPLKSMFSMFWKSWGMMVPKTSWGQAPPPPRWAPLQLVAPAKFVSKGVKRGADDGHGWLPPDENALAVKARKGEGNGPCNFIRIEALALEELVDICTPTMAG